MSNFNIGDTVRIGSGKVEYVVDSFPAEGQAFVIGEKSSRTVETTRLVLVRAAVETAFVEKAAESAREHVTVPETYNRPEDTFDPREDRRQSAYGLAILAQVLRKNPVAGAHNVNPLKHIGSKRAKVRRKVRAQRTALNALARAYNDMRRHGYNIAA